MLNVCLVGRPNVGKSTLFNRFLGYQHSIVEKTPGVTRDRVDGICTWRGKSFVLVDTGGVMENTRHALDEKVLEQVDEAIRRSDLILFVVDAVEGIHPDDLAVASRIRVMGKKGRTILVANKVDSPDQKNFLPECYTLGLGAPFAVSGMHGLGIGDLLDEILDRLEMPSPPAGAPLLRFCVAGRPNVGKSSIVNAILGEPRVIVHEEPGTTRDVVDTTFGFNDDLLVLADTAGLRKRARATEPVEYFSRTRTIRAIRGSDVILLVLEAPSGVLGQDKKIAGEIQEAEKGMIILANKWDLFPQKGNAAYQNFLRHVRRELPFVHYAPVIPTSAATGLGISEILPLVIQVFQAWKQELESRALQSILSDAFFVAPPPSTKGKRFKMKSVFSIGVAPPTLLLKSHNEAKLPDSYLRFLEGKLREVFDLSGTPLRIKLQTPQKRKAGKPA